MRAVPLAIATARQASPGKLRRSGRAAKKSFKAADNSQQRREGVGSNARRQRKGGPGLPVLSHPAISLTLASLPHYHHLCRPPAINLTTFASVHSTKLCEFMNYCLLINRIYS